MATEFSTKSMLEVEVDQRSLREARETVQESVGSIRIQPQMARADGGVGGVSPRRDLGGDSSVDTLLSAQLETLQDIEEKIEKIGATQGGGGGGLNFLAGVTLGRSGMGKAAGPLPLLGGKPGIMPGSMGAKTRSGREPIIQGPFIPGNFESQQRKQIRKGGGQQYDIKTPDLNATLQTAQKINKQLSNIQGPNLNKALNLNTSLQAVGKMNSELSSLSVPDLGFEEQFNFQPPGWIQQLFGSGSGQRGSAARGTSTTDTVTLNKGEERPGFFNPSQQTSNSAKQKRGTPVDLGLDIDISTQDLQRQVESAVRSELQSFNLEREVEKIVKEVLGGR